MPDITNPLAINFCNNQVRPMANRLVRLVRDIDFILSVWNAQNLSTTITNTADPVVDGAASDGRPIASGQRVNNFITMLTAISNNFHANNDQNYNRVINLANQID